MLKTNHTARWLIATALGTLTIVPAYAQTADTTAVTDTAEQAGSSTPGSTQRERFDGSGPLGLAGEQIPVESRLLRVVCACHLTMAAPAHSRAADRAILRIGGGAGKELDPGIAAAMIALIERVDD